MKKGIIFIFFYFCSYHVVSAQSDSISKWSYRASLLPYIHSGYNNFYPFPNDIPAASFLIEYKPFKHFSLQLGIDYNAYLTSILKINPYVSDFGASILYDSKATVHFLELPGSVKYYILDKKKYRLYASFGDVSSFVIAENRAPDPPGVKIQTTIYQNYLQFALGMDIKTKHTWDLYFSPLYRIAMVNYHDAVHYIIWAYPNVFYERMLGVEIGMKFNKLKKKS